MMRGLAVACAVWTVLCLMCTAGTASEIPVVSINYMGDFW